MVIQLKRCCCCCSLKTGTIIFGTIELLFYVPLWFRLSLYSLNSPFADIFQEQIALLFAMDILLGTSILFSILLLYGANNERPNLLEAWIKYAIIMTVLRTIFEVVLIVLFQIHRDHHTGFMSSLSRPYVLPICLISLVVALVLKVYNILVVNSFRTQLIQGTNALDDEMGPETKQ